MALQVKFKSTLERLVLVGGAAAVGAWRLRRRSLILAYHNVVPDGRGRQGQWSAHISLSNFRRQLDLLQRYFDITTLEDVTTPSSNDRPRAALTFDDAYVGAVTLAVDELAARNLPSTCFVTPGFLEGASFWWDALADGEGELDPDHRALVLTKLNGLDGRAREWARSTLTPMSEIPPERTAASLSDLKAAVTRGMSLGAHTWSHPALPTLDAAAVEAELRKPLSWLREHFPNHVSPWLAYPYGLVSPDVSRAAARAGYDGAVLSVGGSFDTRIHSDAFNVPRVTIPASISDTSFTRWILGLRL